MSNNEVYLSKIPQILTSLNLNEEQIKDVILSQKDKSSKYNHMFAGAIAVDKGYITQSQLDNKIIEQSQLILEAAIKDSENIGKMDLTPTNKNWLTKIQYRISTADKEIINDTTNISNLSRYMVINANEQAKSSQLGNANQFDIKNSIKSLGKIHNVIMIKQNNNFTNPDTANNNHHINKLRTEDIQKSLTKSDFDQVKKSIEQFTSLPKEDITNYFNNLEKQLIQHKGKSI